MNVIRHDCEGVPHIVPKLVRVVVDGFYDHVSQSRLTKVERTAAGLIQQLVQHGKGFAGAEGGGGEASIRRQAAVETPGEEDRPLAFIDVRKASAVKCHARVVA